MEYLPERQHERIQSDIASLRQEVGSSTRTKPRTYVLLNPDLSVSPVYGRTSVPEYQGIALSRFRVSSHNLAIETGRWSRTPPERRLCPCGMVQTEEHLVCYCHLTSQLRAAHSLTYASISSILNDANIYLVRSLIHKCLILLCNFCYFLMCFIFVWT